MREPALPPGVPEPLDRELLAWAAGFFDGEGSTIAKSDRRRPDYFQCNLSVPQAGRGRTPEVLTKFQRAMLGMGRVRPERDGLYVWRADGRISTEIALALLWPWLGDVKRRQAADVREVVARQYTEGRHSMHAPRHRPQLVAHVFHRGPAEERRLELAWAAGFLDAEGNFGLPKSYERRDGSTGYVIRASATQHGVVGGPPHVLSRLRRILGMGRIERHGEPDDFKWVAEGVLHVRRVLELLEPWLGDVKIAQAGVALAKHEASRVRGDAERCKRGHLYDRVHIRPNGTIHRICITCQRWMERKRRAIQGIEPRRFRHPERRLEDPALLYAA